MTKHTKTRIVAITALLAVAGYILPFVVTQAGSEPPAGVSALPSDAQTLAMRITAYASVPDETDDTPFITANGTRVRDGIVATNLLPFGTEIKIPSLFGDKVFVVEDRMAPEFKKSIDIWMPSVDKAVYFGLHYADVVVVSPAQPLALAVAAHAATASSHVTR